MFAGDKFKPAADASYRNLFWENFYVDHSFDIGTKIQRNKEIGTIDSLGPFFRVSFDLIIHSFHQDEWSSLLAFLYSCHYCINGDRIPALFLDYKGTGNGRDGEILISNTVDNSKDYFHFKIELNHWYNIVIEQNSINGKVIKL